MVVIIFGETMCHACSLAGVTRKGSLYMQLDKLTIKAQEAVQQAQRLAEQRRHAEYDVEHLILALLDQEEGVACPLVERLGASVEGLRSGLESALGKRATVEGAAERYPSRGLREVLQRAFTLAERMKGQHAGHADFVPVRAGAGGQ